MAKANTATKADKALMLAVLAHAKKDAGVKEVRGKGTNERIREMLITTGNANINNDEDSWCAVAHGAWQAECGNPIPSPKPNNRAGITYETWGKKLDKPEIGCTCTSTYTKLGRADWRRHVALVDEIDWEGRRVRLWGGNQMNAVNGSVWKSFAEVTAWRAPVAPTKKALREAGSSEMKSAANLKNLGTLVGAGTSAAAGAQAYATTPATPVAATIPTAPVAPPVEVLAPSAADPSLIDLGRQAADGFDVVSTVVTGAQTVGSLCMTHWWVAGGIAFAAGAWWIATRWENSRLKKHLAGMPLAKEIMEIFE